MPSDTGALDSPILDHVGVIVKDIDTPMDFLSSIWPIGPQETKWGLGTKGVIKCTPTKDEVLAGETFKLQFRWAKVGPIIVDLIEPLDENSLWAQFLKTTGGGAHHIALSVSNFDGWVSTLQKQGARMLTGMPLGGKRWAYFDLGPGGFILEIVER